MEVEDSDAEDDLCHWVVKSDPYPSSPVKMAAEAGAAVEHSLQGAITDSGASVLEEPLIAKEEGAMRDQLKLKSTVGRPRRKCQPRRASRSAVQVYQSKRLRTGSHTLRHLVFDVTCLPGPAWLLLRVNIYTCMGIRRPTQIMPTRA